MVRGVGVSVTVNRGNFCAFVCCIVVVGITAISVLGVYGWGFAERAKNAPIAAAAAASTGMTGSLGRVRYIGTAAGGLSVVMMLGVHVETVTAAVVG